MDHSITTRRNHLKRRFRELSALGMVTQPRPVEPLAGRVQHFDSEQAKHDHLAYVRAILADASGPSPF